MIYLVNWHTTLLGNKFVVLKSSVVILLTCFVAGSYTQSFGDYTEKRIYSCVTCFYDKQLSCHCGTVLSMD